MNNNGDTHRLFNVGKELVRGLGSFHKSLPRNNEFGEVNPEAFDKLVAAAASHGELYENVPPKANHPNDADNSARLTNPQAGFAADRLTPHPTAFVQPPAPHVLSITTAAEMVELYWMACLRDVSFADCDANGKTWDDHVKEAAAEIGKFFQMAVNDLGDPGRLRRGVDVPGTSAALSEITPKNVFRMGLPGEEFGPLVSQFFVRNANFGTQLIDQQQFPYKTGQNYLTRYADWLHAQETGRGADGNDYPKANEKSDDYYPANKHRRYIGTMRDLARFVNKDALHQAYFNAALLLLSGGAKWTTANPYASIYKRQAGFGTLGGPHILALVSEIASRGLKVVWNQKWRVHLRLRPEAYGGLVHLEKIGINGAPDKKRPYGLPKCLWEAKVLDRVRELNAASNSEFPSEEQDTLLLPMAFTSGSPTHPAYGAGHATVAGACVTILKGYFNLFKDDSWDPLLITALQEKMYPWSELSHSFKTIITGKKGEGDTEDGYVQDTPVDDMTIEGELNKLASNVAMGRSMGGVHWRTDNTRSLILGEAIAAKILADITTDLSERPTFRFRTFARKEDCQPKRVVITEGRIIVDGKVVDPVSEL